MRFVFQQSRIYEGGNDVDVKMKTVKIKVPKDDEERARKLLPDPETGRTWILVSKEDA